MFHFLKSLIVTKFFEICWLRIDKALESKFLTALGYYQVWFQIYNKLIALLPYSRYLGNFQPLLNYRIFMLDKVDGSLFIPIKFNMVVTFLVTLLSILYYQVYGSRNAFNENKSVDCIHSAENNYNYFMNKVRYN